MEKELSKVGFWQQVYLTVLKENLSKGFSGEYCKAEAYIAANRAIEHFGYEVQTDQGCLRSEFVRMVTIAPNTINPNNGDK